MAVNYATRTCTKCHREYSYWKDKGLFNSRKYCPDCYISQKSKEVSGLPIENMAGKEKPLNQIWVNKQVVNLVIKVAGLTGKQKAAVSKFMAEGKVPENKSSYYEAIRKMKKAGKLIFLS